MSESRFRVLEWVLLAIIAWVTLANFALTLMWVGFVAWTLFSRF
jgi:hypothetical protein